MLFDVHPVLPMRNKKETKEFYVTQLGFSAFDDGENDKFPRYLMIHKDKVEIHFFLAEQLIVTENDGCVYIRTDNADEWYQLAITKQLNITEPLAVKPWQQKEFVIKDPNNNTIVFGGNIN